MVRGNTVRQGTVGHALHVGLVDTRAQFAAEVTVDGEPFLGDLPFHLHIGRGRKRHILHARQQLSPTDIQVKVHAYMDIEALAAIGVVRLHADDMPRVVQRVRNGIGADESVDSR